MKEYVLKHVAGQPDWSQIPVLLIDHQRKENKDNVSAQAQLCWDEEGIFVHLSCKEKNIRKECTHKFDPIYEDSCLEFFIRPTDDIHFFNIEFNANCAVFLGYSKGKPNIIRLILPNHMETFKPVVNFTADGWEIFYKVPFALIQNFFHDFEPKSGLEFRGNCFKCGDKTVHPHYLMWNPIPEGISFHAPDHFGRMILE